MDLEKGVKLRVLDDAGVPALLTYVGRSRDGGYRVKGKAEDPETWSKDEMTRLRLDRRVEIYPGDPEVDDEWISHVLSRTFASFPPQYRLVADRKAAYCVELKRRVAAGEAADNCLADVAQDVFAANVDAWHEEDVRLEAQREEVASKRRRKPPSELKRQRKPKVLKAPNPQVVYKWYRLWRDYKEDIRVLIPAWNKRGQAGPRYDLHFYDWMRDALEKHFLVRDSGSDVRYAYKEFVKRCKAEGLEDADEARKAGRPRPYPTYTAFLDFKNLHVAARDEMRIREGSRQAYLAFHVFKRQERPQRVLAEVEIDHCLIDLIVVHPRTGRALGRPWLTALLDRASSMILGMHLSLADPGYAGVQRCLAHSFWPKDLRGYPDLRNPWP